MKRVIQCAVLITIATITYWFYLNQFGAVPFLLLSIFFFYKAYRAYHGRSKNHKVGQRIDHSAASTGKKAEIIT
ncbi:hypothetical protein [Domibacillus mangrovi]|uniref:Uncharacterized protein n=1 Tax=Domibacillus mangrovi TaxID=1714354 RepID=A0A1Q5P5W3_9BACI|nr:hypothetical protein [Domibacillus mangrovi]OKL37558.1 hypothetical protein BLL40_04420 [Domibacillus mangrovi]